MIKHTTYRLLGPAVLVAALVSCGNQPVVTNPTVAPVATPTIQQTSPAVSPNATAQPNATATPAAQPSPTNDVAWMQMELGPWRIELPEHWQHTGPGTTPDGLDLNGTYKDHGYNVTFYNPSVVDPSLESPESWIRSVTNENASEPTIVETTVAGAPATVLLNTPYGVPNDMVHTAYIRQNDSTTPLIVTIVQIDQGPWDPEQARLFFEETLGRITI